MTFLFRSHAVAEGEIRVQKLELNSQVPIIKRDRKLQRTKIPSIQTLSLPKHYSLSETVTVILRVERST